jgi:hypothetical protein
MKYLNLEIVRTGQILANTDMTDSFFSVTGKGLNSISVEKVTLRLMYIN